MSLATALLCACGGSPMSIGTADNANVDASALTHHKEFFYTGAKQRFIVPAGVTRLTVSAHGGQGAGFGSAHSAGPGFPGRVYAVIPVHAGEKLYVFVGGSGEHGGFNGGGDAGAAGSGTHPGYPGGGASDVRAGRDRLEDRILVAAGGGGKGVAFYYSFANGGNGGGLTGQSGGGAGYHDSGGGGGGGTQTSGGSGGAGGQGYSNHAGQPGGSGAFGHGGTGGNGGPGTDSNAYPDYGLPGGGGGGGYYGGGGGGGGAGTDYGRYSGGQGGGGGGGSSYVEPSAISVHMWTGWTGVGDGDGRVVVSWK